MLDKNIRHDNSVTVICCLMLAIEKGEGRHVYNVSGAVYPKRVTWERSSCVINNYCCKARRDKDQC